MIDYQYVCYKLDANSGLIWQEAVEHFGLSVIEDPFMSESCDFWAFIVTKEKPTDEQMAEIMCDIYKNGELEDYESMWKYLTPERRAILDKEIAEGA